MMSYITVKMIDGTYKNISEENVVSMMLHKDTCEIAVTFKEKGKMKFGIMAYWNGLNQFAGVSKKEEQ